MKWLQGGPYYELSFLMNNSENRIELLKGIVKLLDELPNFKIVDTIKEIEEEIKNYNQGFNEDEVDFRTFGIKAKAKIAGERKLRIHLTELSSELIKLNLWFFGSLFDAEEWNQKGIKIEDKPEFKIFFSAVKAKLKPVCGTIAYEEDCEEVFATDVLSPNEYFSIANLDLQKITARLNKNRNEFEYFWMNKDVIGNSKEIEIIIETG